MKGKNNTPEIIEIDIPELNESVKTNKGKHWSDSEIKLMEKYYEWADFALLEKYLPTKSRSQIYDMGKRLGLCRMVKKIPPK